MFQTRNCPVSFLDLKLEILDFRNYADAKGVQEQQQLVFKEVDAVYSTKRTFSSIVSVANIKTQLVTSVTNASSHNVKFECIYINSIHNPSVLSHLWNWLKSPLS